MSHENIVIYMADSVRRDYFPEFDEGVTVPAVAQGPNTPTSYPAILSGRGPDHHGVSWFQQHVKTPTVLDLDQKGYDTALWDFWHSKDNHDPVYHIFRYPERKELTEMDVPFVWTKRETITHIPYNRTWERTPMEVVEKHDGRKYPDIRGSEYIDQMRKGEVDYIQDYKDSIQESKKMFLELVENLKQMGVYDDTLVVYCADHGDAFPEDNRKGIIHNVNVPEVIDVAIHFHNPTDAEKQRINVLKNRQGEMALKDIVRVWKEDWDDIHADLDLPEASEDIGKQVKDRLEELGYAANE